jgi:hypothetical protein
MSLKRYAARRDETEAGIVKALRQAGAHVLRLDLFDLLVLYRGKVFMLDAKAVKGRATKAQQAMTAAGWPLTYVRDEIAALRAIGAVR